MTEKRFPVSQEKLEEIIKKYPTPFHIYDEKAIRQNLRRLFKAFAWAPSFREHYAVKAAPNPRLLQVLREEGAGAVVGQGLQDYDAVAAGGARLPRERAGAGVFGAS